MKMRISSEITSLRDVVFRVVQKPEAVKFCSIYLLACRL